jgi:hypothetical protein
MADGAVLADSFNEQALFARLGLPAEPVSAR